MTHPRKTPAEALRDAVARGQAVRDAMRHPPAEPTGPAEPTEPKGPEDG